MLSPKRDGTLDEVTRANGAQSGIKSVLNGY